jgi:predicted ATPase
MGKPVMQNRLTKNIRLDYDGRNIAEYILWIRAQGQEYLDNIVQKMIFVLPYIKQIQPNIQDTFSREIELLLHETNDKSKPLPGWLLSSGTLRILALLSVFDTPKKPSTLFIDEIENGLDPRTLGLLVNEIENEYQSKGMQVIVTSHSPYFLDLIPLESVIVAEKDEIGSSYNIPNNEESLSKWKEKFSPGKLYTMGKLTK